MNTYKLSNIQKQARDNVKTMQTYMTDLQNWETEMKRKEAALKGENEQDLPPVRSKIKKDKPVLVKKAPEKRIKSSDYDAWNKFDTDKACEEIDMEDVGPCSLDAKKSAKDKLEKLRDEAQYEKERGNGFVKQEKWDEAISCYNRAIELVKDDPIYYANRGLCHLKKESLHKAESDCTEALRLDPTYVKALQRRATAREGLGSLRAASNDLVEVLRLEPHNSAARRQLHTVKGRMGTKGTKSKSSPTATPTNERRPDSGVKIVELTDSSDGAKPEKPEMTAEERWINGVDEPITVIKTVKKPPHLRSKRALMNIPIQEIPLGKTSPEKSTGNKMKIIEIEDSLSKGDSNNNEKELPGERHPSADGDKASRVNGIESVKLASDVKNTEFTVKVGNLVPPVNSVQFTAEWKNLANHSEARGHYLSIIDPAKIPSIFANALESDVLSQVLESLHQNKERFKDKGVAAYLKGLVRVKRFSALAMFLSSSDKELVNKLLVHCATTERCPDEDIVDLKEKFEL